MPRRCRLVLCRRDFRYLIAPDARLVASILSLSTSELAAAESALRVASDLAQQQLTAASETRAGKSDPLNAFSQYS